MFNWLFKRLQLEPPKLTRDDVEQSRKAPELKTDLEFPKGVHDIEASEAMIAAENIIKKSYGYSVKAYIPRLTKIVPIEDYELIKKIRMGIAQGEGFEIGTPEMFVERQTNGIQLSEKQLDGIESGLNETHYNNAKALNEFYGLSKDEIFELTGCYLK